MKPKLRAVVDTNLFISGIFGKESLSAKLQDFWIQQDFELVTSQGILKEVSRVLQYPRVKEKFRPNEETIRRFFRLAFRKAVITRDLYKVDRITDDPADNMFLACALEAKADYIVSRDPHLRNLKHFHGIKITGVKEFIDQVKTRGAGFKS